MHRRWLFSIGGPALVAVAFLAINLGAGPILRSARVDLTENDIHTLSEGTVKLLGSLPSDITVRLFWSEKVAKDLPAVQNYARGVKDLLKEYEALSGGKLTLEVVDPRPFSEEEDDALSLGLQGVPVDAGGETLYLGVAVLAEGGARKVIPFLQPDRERFLEYDLSSAIHALAKPERPTVAVLSALPLDGFPTFGGRMGGMPQPWAVMESLRSAFDVRMLGPGAMAVPKETDVLLLVHPHGLDADALYAADQFVLGGGRALVFADPLSESEAQQGPAGAVSEHGRADSLLAAWGVRLSLGKVVGDMDASQRVSYSDGMRSHIVNYLPWIFVRDDRISRDEVATSQLGVVNLASAGALEPVEGSGIEVVPLLKTTGNAMLIDAEKVAFAPDPRRIAAEFTPAGTPYVLAARLSGAARTAFPGGPPAADAKEAKELGPQVKESSGPINVVVVADSDLLADRFWVDVRNFFGRRIAFPIADNGDLAVNLIDVLGQSPDLVSLRGRAPVTRPFTLLERIARQAEGRYRAKEQELAAGLQETERKLAELQGKRSDQESASLTPEQEKEVEGFRQEKVRIRKELRDVQFQLREDIERLESRLKFVNIGLVPLVVGLFSVGLWVFQRRRDRRYAS